MWLWAGDGDIGAAAGGARSTIDQSTIPDAPAIGPVGTGIRIHGGHDRAVPFILPDQVALRRSRIDQAMAGLCRCRVGRIAHHRIDPASIRRAPTRDRGGLPDRIKTGEGLARRRPFFRCRRVRTAAAASTAIGLPVM
jgi:hypothetical protein